ncbi:hypothetical protein PUV54_12435 [Hyphococcus flavus]|uniref:Uncharacterized protein n=1 Tax=Hyphococcus flavus TaxID=1866326 RepID=A0AAF0CBE4_9PROT|nr:hypothetical protein [Hyphococcus flavus]WDI30760.1 hypothetical protein PUV54_12435 [Hyphococcus flavus]
MDCDFGIMHRPWHKLAESYDEFASMRGEREWVSAHKALAALCRYIDASIMKDSLYGHTSMLTLSISQTAVEYPPPPTTPWLRIEPLEDGDIEFCYEDTKKKERQWRRVVQPKDTIARFQRFVDQLGWSTVPLSE